MELDEDLVALANKSAPAGLSMGGADLDEDLVSLANNTARIQAQKQRRARLDSFARLKEANEDLPVASNPLIGLGRGLKNIYGGVRQALPESMGGFSDEQEADFEKERQFYESLPRRLGVDVAEAIGPAVAIGGAGAAGQGFSKGAGALSQPIARVPALPGAVAGGAVAGGASFIPPGSDVSRLAMAATGAGLGPLGLLGGRMLERGGRGVFAPRAERSFYRQSGEGPLAGDASKLFRRGLSQGAEPGAAYGAAQGATLPSRYPLTRGQSTGDTDLLRWEHEARNGVHGPLAEAKVKELDAKQASAGQANRDAIRRDAGGRAGPYVKGESIDRLEETLRERSSDLKTEIGSAYGAAMDAGRVYAPADGLRAYRKSLSRELVTKEGFDITEPRLKKALKPLDNLIKMKGFKAAEVNQIEVLRKRLNNVYGDTKVSEPSVARAARIAIGRLDETMDSMLEAGLINGDRNMLDLYRNARALNTRHSRLFSDDKVIEKLTSDALSPEQKANVLFGSARLSSKGDAVQAVRKLRKEFGEDSSVMRDIKDEAVMRLFYNQPTEGFSAQKFVTEFDEVFTKGKGRTIMNELFTRDQMNTVQQLRNVARRSVIDPTTFNASRTSYAMANLVNRLVPGASGIAGATPWIGKIAKEFRDSARAAAVGSQIPRKTGGGVPYGAAAGSGADELMEEN